MNFAKPGDPLVTNGTQIVQPEGRAPQHWSLQVPDAKTFRAKRPRSTRELSVDAQTQTIINAILMYQLLGVSTNEIAHVLNTTSSEVSRVMALSAYQETFAMMFNELLSVNSDSLQARMAHYAANAIDNVFELAGKKGQRVTKVDDDGQKYVTEEYAVPPIVVLKANQDILDRVGLAPDVLFGKTAQNAAPQLEIVITSGSDVKTDIKINTK